MAYAGRTVCLLMEIIYTTDSKGFSLTIEQWAGIKPIFPQLLIPTSRRVQQGTYAFLAAAAQYPNICSRRVDIRKQNGHWARTRNFDFGEETYLPTNHGRLGSHMDDRQPPWNPIHLIHIYKGKGRQIQDG